VSANDGRGEATDPADVTQLAPRVSTRPVAQADVPTEAVPMATTPAHADTGGRRWGWLAAAAVVLFALIVGGIVAFGGGGVGDTVATEDGGQGGGGSDGLDDADGGVADGAVDEPTATPVATATPAPTATPTPEPTAIPTPEPTATPTPVPVCTTDGGRCIEMTQLAVAGDGLVIDWVATDFEPAVNGGFHAHFYWNTFDSNQAGNNAASFGAETGQWAAVDAQPWSSLDNNFSLSGRPAGATEICVTVGTAAHAIDNPDEFHCLAIAESA